MPTINPASATSVAGRTLGTPYTFSFSTPSARLTSMRWYRRADRFDRPVVLMLDFNQPMRATDVIAHTRLRYQRHEVEPPLLLAEALKKHQIPPEKFTAGAIGQSWDIQPVAARL